MQGIFMNPAIGVVLVSLLLTLNIFHTLFYSVSIVNFEHVIVGWERSKRERLEGTVSWCEGLLQEAYKELKH